MNDHSPDLTPLVRAIHKAKRPLVLAVTGGGSAAIGELLRVPGGSQTLIEAIVPYSSAALIDFLRTTPESYCSPRTSRLMAMAAMTRGQRLMGSEMTPLVVGIGCTASLASDRPKRGEHRAHIAVQTLDFTETVSLRLEKEVRSRGDEEDLVASLILNRLHAAVCGDAFTAQMPTLALRSGDDLRIERTLATSEWRQLLTGERTSWCAVAKTPSPIIFPGAFHPLHDGHREIMKVAEEMLAATCEPEISVVNVDKPPLDYFEIAQRLAQFSGEHNVWLTRAATFVEKARLFPGATFVVGADTIVRIAEPRYYANTAERDDALREFAARGCRFLVFGRLIDGTFRTLRDIPLPLALAMLCQEIPSNRFRHDISSTVLRRTTMTDAS